MNKLVIIGAGGHAKVIADSALKIGYKDIVFLDDNAAGECMGFPVVGKICDIPTLNNENTDFVIGIGNNSVRKRIAESYDVNWTSIVHPSAQIAINASVGKGTVVMAGAIINASAKVGDHCIINTAAVVEHDNLIGNYVHLSPRATLSGTVTVGDNTWIGTGVSVINNVEICADVIIGVGSTVIKKIDSVGTYVGVPARKIK